MRPLLSQPEIDLANRCLESIYDKLVRISTGLVFDGGTKIVLEEARSTTDNTISLYSVRAPELEAPLLKLARLKTTPAGCYLCGGFFRDIMLDKTKISDMDFYFKSKKHAKEFEDNIEGKEEVMLHVSRRGDLSEFYGGAFTLQTIGWVFYPDVPSVLDTYDFTNCMHGYDFETKQFYTTDGPSTMKLNVNATSRKWKSLMRYIKIKGKHPSIQTPEDDLKYLVIQSSFEVLTGMAGDSDPNKYI